MNPYYGSTFLRSFNLWADLVQKSSAMAWSAGHVIGQRTARMAQAGATPSARDQREMTTMVSEKRDAALASWMAMTRRYTSLNQTLWTDALRMTQETGLAAMPLWTSATPAQYATRSQALANKLSNRSVATLTRQLDASAKIASAGLAPVHARVHANRKRLAKRG